MSDDFFLVRDNILNLRVAYGNNSKQHPNGNSWTELTSTREYCTKAAAA